MFIWQERPVRIDSELVISVKHTGSPDSMVTGPPMSPAAPKEIGEFECPVQLWKQGACRAVSLFADEVPRRGQALSII